MRRLGAAKAADGTAGVPNTITLDRGAFGTRCSVTVDPPREPVVALVSATGGLAMATALTPLVLPSLHPFADGPLRRLRPGRTAPPLRIAAV